MNESRLWRRSSVGIELRGVSEEAVEFTLVGTSDDKVGELLLGVENTLSNWFEDDGVIVRRRVGRLVMGWAFEETKRGEVGWITWWMDVVDSLPEWTCSWAVLEGLFETLGEMGVREVACCVARVEVVVAVVVVVVSCCGCRWDSERGGEGERERGETGETGDGVEFWGGVWIRGGELTPEILVVGMVRKQFRHLFLLQKLASGCRHVQYSSIRRNWVCWGVWMKSTNERERCGVWRRQRMKEGGWSWHCSLLASCQPPFGKIGDHLKVTLLHREKGEREKPLTGMIGKRKQREQSEQEFLYSSLNEKWWLKFIAGILKRG